ncbi:MAG TPA: SGNH/GDSL hydrolase family protein [Chitinophagaceae bacterium]|nr:SGNH/GDSL hydrolase family protein [Chitinophagaceae bacterium]
MRRVCIAVLLLSFFGVYGQNKKLSVIGSSTSACTGPSSFATCYLGRLDTYQDGIAQPMDLFQLAVGGYTVYKGMPSWFVGPSPNLQPDVNNNVTRALSFTPDVVLVNYPSNGYDTLSIDSIMRCFRTIRAEVNAQGKTCYITTTQPRHAFPFNTMAARQKLKTLRDSIINAFGYFAVDFWDGLTDPVTLAILPAFDSGDGIHLNDAGHDILFQRVRDKNIFAVQLPVKLTAFNARLQQGSVVSTWSVADELAGTRYELQRSVDGVSFSTIHTVITQSAANKQSYIAVDKTATTGTYYYRLRVVEAARTFFSQAIKVVCGKAQVALKSFSIDPLQQQVVIKMAAAGNHPIQLRFVNSQGILVRKSTYLLHAGENRLSIPLQIFATGIYWAECVLDDERIFTKTFMKR